MTGLGVDLSTDTKFPMHLAKVEHLSGLIRVKFPHLGTFEILMGDDLVVPKFKGRLASKELDMSH
jgi:hypothetical protein